jgi:hypothetical protein
MIFDFTPPDASDLPRMHGVLEARYVQGRQGSAAHRVAC